MIGPQFPDEAPAAVTNRTLRQFAAICLGFFGALFVLSEYRHSGSPSISAWVGLAIGLLVGLPGLVHPPAIRPAFLGATAITQPIGHVISTILLGFIYYGLMTPLALLFRIAGRDSLARYGPALASYWEVKIEPKDVRRYLRQYQGQASGRMKNEG
jgi:drug/metabolite transporter (DMT)-like permease